MNESQTKEKYAVNLPETKFPMKANGAVREPEFQQFWEESKIYEKNLAQRNKSRKFVLHDGPPYLSSNKIHIGTALNKILKDIVTKYKAQRGFYSPYVPGYDSHGLPIENAVLKDVKGGRAALTPVELRRRCRDFALGNLKGQEANFKRLGVWGNWEQPYITLDPKFEATQIRVFGKMAEAGYLYKGLKSVQWCPNCETALAEAEVEYADHKSDSIYVKFPVAEDSRAKMPAAVKDEKDLSFVIWTTTPWTLPANLGVALHPDFEYVFLKTPKDGVVIIAEQLREQVTAEVGWEAGSIKELARVKGKDLELANARHPFADRNSLVMIGDHVTADTGTGVVHTAPGHGPEDFELGAKYKVGVLNPVDPRGIYTEEGGQWAGQRFDKSNPLIVEHLREIGALLKHSTYSHSYPHCWRCKKPLIFRATEQWFASVDGFRKQALKAIDEVQWLPASGRNRIFTMVENRSDWCISRQRAWGVPIPVVYCNACSKPVITSETIEKVATTFGEHGSDAWWEKEAEEFVGKDFKCPHCKENKGYTKETDIMDVWFDSGVTHAAVIDARSDELGGTPCEMYLEGSDQHRGWFQSSLLTSVATKGRAPYKTVLTHGFVVDETGRKMSKSVGNVVEPDAVIKQYGADVLRLWVASVNYTDDIPIGKNMLAQLADVYFRLRNTARYLLGNLFDFDPAKDTVPYEELDGLEKYILHRLQDVVHEVIADFDSYEFFKYYQLLQNFCAVDLSAFYFDIVKDPLYAAGKKSKQRRAVQTVLNEVLQVLVRLLVPVTPHLAEDIWKHMPDALRGKEESVLLTNFPEPNAKYQSASLSADWNQLIEVRSVVNKALEQARASGKIGKPMDAQVNVFADKPEVAKLLQGLGKELAPFFITSQANVVASAPAESDANALSYASANGVTVQVLPAAGTKCPRCRKFAQDVGANKRYPELCAPCAEALG
jgi:isoleucyl-tRNA synthetase